MGSVSKDTTDTQSKSVEKMFMFEHAVPLVPRSDNFTAISGERKGILLSMKLLPCLVNLTIIQNDDVNK